MAEADEIAIVKNYLQTLPPDHVLRQVFQNSGKRNAAFFHAYWSGLGKKFAANLRGESPELFFDCPELEKAIDLARNYYWQLLLTCIQAYEGKIFPKGLIELWGGVGELVKHLTMEDFVGMAICLQRKQFLTPKVKDFERMISLRSKGLKGKFQDRATYRDRLHGNDGYEEVREILAKLDPNLIPDQKELEACWTLNLYVRSLFLANKTRLKNYKAFCSALRERDQYNYRQVLKQGDEIRQKR